MDALYTIEIFFFLETTTMASVMPLKIFSYYNFLSNSEQ
jgi:hypothetical protein